MEGFLISSRLNGRVALLLDRDGDLVRSEYRVSLDLNRNGVPGCHAGRNYDVDLIYARELRRQAGEQDLRLDSTDHNRGGDIRVTKLIDRVSTICDGGGNRT